MTTVNGYDYEEYDDLDDNDEDGDYDDDAFREYEESREPLSDDSEGNIDGVDSLNFADPGGRSALRAATKSNPRNLPCPTCKRPNMLTPADVRNHYQCDSCADRDEGGF